MIPASASHACFVGALLHKAVARIMLVKRMSWRAI